VEEYGQGYLEKFLALREGLNRKKGTPFTDVNNDTVLILGNAGEGSV
jgi:hypothetical protein